MPDVQGGYERIMLAVDLTEESNKVAERACALAAAYDHLGLTAPTDVSTGTLFD